MEKVKWGVLGCSSFARRRTIPAMLVSPSVELVGIASRAIEKARAFCDAFGVSKAYGSYDEMLADPAIEAVYIPLPNGLHGEWMIRAAACGKHSLCEKPFTSSPEEAARVAQAAREHGVLVMEAFMWRFHPQHLRARAAVDGGEIGAVRLLRGAFTFQIGTEPNVRLHSELTGGCVMDVGCYPISAARYYFGAEPVAVYARGEADPRHAVDMHACGILEFPAGRALFDCAFDLPYRTRLEITGENGIIQIPKPWLPDPEAVITINGKEEKMPAASQYVNEFEHFSCSVRGGSVLRYGPEDAILQMKVIDAVLRSIQSHKAEEIR